MEREHAIVTGGAGFIGSHVAEALIASGHRVDIIDDLSTGRRENVPAGAALHVLDIRSKEAASLVTDLKPTRLFHLAAQMDVRKSVYDPSFDADVNIRGALNLIEAGRRSGLRQVVFSSTGGAIYGEQRAYPAAEDHPEWPLSPYGITKLALEKYLFYYHAGCGLDAMCLRYANVYGPRQNAHGEAGVIAIFARRLLAGQAPTIFGDGENTRDYVFVGDVVRANLASLGRPGFHILNVGTGVETTVNQVFARLREITHARVEPIYEKARPGEQRRSSIAADKLASELGVTVDTNLAAGLARTVEWFRQNPA